MKSWPTLKEAKAFLHEGRGRGIKIAILDSGVEASHPKLGGHPLETDLAVIDDGLRLVTVPGEGKDVFGHGTAIAGIIHELAPEATIGSFRVLGEQLRSRSLLIREGARLALDAGYHILNCSFGCAREDHVLLYKDWIDEAYIRRRHVVAACNNQDFMKREWPGHFPTVVTANFTRVSEPESFFYRSGDLVEFAASGQDIDVAWQDGGYKKVTGSSFATPHLAALLARILSAAPGLGPLEAKALLQRLAEPFPLPQLA